MKLLLAVPDIHEIAPPVDYSLVPPWVIYASVLLGLAVLGLIGWWIRKLSRRPKPQQTPRDRALQELNRIRNEMETLTPYQFSIHVSDVLRRYVTDQYQLPVTKQ